MKRHQILSTFFLAFLAGLFLFAVITAWDFPFLARLFPMTVAAAALLASLLEAFRMHFARQELGVTKTGISSREAVFRANVIKALPFLGWFMAYYTAIFLVGFLMATALFVFAFLYKRGRMIAVHAALSALLAVAAVYMFGMTLALEWPQGVLNPSALTGDIDIMMLLYH